MTERVLSLLVPPTPDDGQPADAGLLPAPAGWPAPPDRAVYHELLGEIVNRIAPNTEADPVAILTQLLVTSVPRSAAARGSPSRRLGITATSTCAWSVTQLAAARVRPGITSAG